MKYSLILFLSSLFLLLKSYCCFGQDMPLHEIIPQTGWWSEMKQSDNVISTEGLTTLKLRFSKVPFQYDIHLSDHSIWLKRGDEKPIKLELGIPEPAGLVAIHHEGTMMIGDASSKYLWAFRINQDGSLVNPEKYATLRLPGRLLRSDVSVLLTDNRDRTYAATPYGIQIYDPTGRMCGVLTLPLKAIVTSMSWGGEEGDQLQIVQGGKRFSRPMLAKRPGQNQKKK